MTVELTRVGDYELVSRLGSGGMGDVYFGVSPTAEPVAVKVIRPQLVSDDTMRERFAAEAESLKMIFGSRVARLENADPYADPAWLAVEYVPGLTLKQYVEARGPIPTTIVAMIGAMLADGLAKVHQGGLLHRDLKPQNIILGPDGPVLIDFGLAVLTQREPGQELTAPGTPIGTPAYMAPEQARGDRGLTTAVDIYGLAATLVFALTGRTLYPASTWLTLIGRIRDPADQPDLTGVPTAWASLVGAMLAFDPSARPELSSVRDSLLRVATHGGGSVAQLRAQVAEQTYDDQARIAVPSWLADPVVDPEQPESDADPEGRKTIVEETVVPSVPARRPDLAWLMEKLRRQYARRSTL